MIIAITSGGKNWVGGICPPEGKMHGKKIVQMIFDVEEGMPVDPAGTLPAKTGLDPDIRGAILGNVALKVWFVEKLNDVLSKINFFKKDELENNKVILHFGFRCKGGFQRSVVMAEELAKILREEWQTCLPGITDQAPTVIVHHMTMELALAVKQALGVIKI